MKTSKLQKFTRTQETERQYLHKASELMKRCRLDLEIDDIHPLDYRQFVGWLVCLKQDWKANTWKQYKAAVSYILEKEMETIGKEDKRYHIAKEAYRFLKTQNQYGTQKTSEYTSAKKMKKCAMDDFVKIMAVLENDTVVMKQHRINVRLNNSRWRGALIHWMYAGILTGLRPIEWATSEIIETDESVKLIVKNGKNTNGRTHGDTRTIDITLLSDSEKEHIREMVKIANEQNNANTYEAFKVGCSNLLSTTYKKIFPTRKEKISLYSLRHQFSANAKMSGFTREEIAALMGHAVDDTATVHYAKKRSGHSVCMVMADPEEVKRIRKTFVGISQVKENKVEHTFDNNFAVPTPKPTTE